MHSVGLLLKYSHQILAAHVSTGVDALALKKVFGPDILIGLGSTVFDKGVALVLLITWLLRVPAFNVLSPSEWQAIHLPHESEDPLGSFW